jgi:4-hydroxy-3-methylbut-2-enyl diphosphate reductase
MIYYPKTYGTCSGANKAITLAYKLKKDNKDKNIVIYKEILHNPYVINELKKDNIICVNNLEEINKNDIVIIRAHGETLDTFKYLENKNIEYYDATCINVKKVHDIVLDKYNEGYKIIIVGKKTHPEVIATNSRCNNEGIIIESENDYKYIENNDKYYVVCQTTIGYEVVSSLLN